MQTVSVVTNKWADYGLEKVRYNRTRTHIEMIQVRPVSDDGSLGVPITVTRDQAIRAIEQGTVMKTIVAIPGTNRYNIGALVEVVMIGGKKFLKTVRNNTPVDNLDGLPEF